MKLLVLLFMVSMAGKIHTHDAHWARDNGNVENLTMHLTENHNMRNSRFIVLRKEWCNKECFPESHQGFHKLRRSKT
jgi:hypothetical protein